MSDEINLPEGDNVFTLGKRDGAIVFREDGVELLLPDIDLEADLPKHLAPLMAFALILGNEPKLQAAIDDMYKAVDEQQNK